jgi:hypothetical protein
VVVRLAIDQLRQQDTAYAVAQLEQRSEGEGRQAVSYALSHE